MTMLDPTSSRVMLLRLNVKMLPLLLRQGARWTLVANPLPADARIHRWWIEPPPREDLLAVVISESFPEVADGARIPEMPAPTFREDESA